MIVGAISPSSILTGVLSLLVLIGLVGYTCWRLIVTSDDPDRMVKRLIYTAILFGMMFFYFRKMAGVGSTGGVADYGTAFLIAGGAAAFGLVLAIIWGSEIGSWIAKPFANLYLGGNSELEPQPFYAIAEAKRKRGDYQASIKAVREQLEKFPHDIRGTMMIASIQADDLKDLRAAEQTLETLVSEGNLPPPSLAYVLGRLADWHLALAQDPVAARAALERIIQLCPASEHTMLALQRIAHLATADQLAEVKEHRKIHVVRHEEKLGLRPDFTTIQVTPKETPHSQAEHFVARLVEHPYDNDAREQLALLYMDDFNRPDLALDQLEQLIAQPHQIQSHMVRWLNLKADIHLKHRQDLAASQAAIQTIIDLYPDSAAAQNATKRMAYLPGELAKLQSRHEVKLGTYEQRAGLKMKSSRAWTGEDQEDNPP